LLKSEQHSINYYISTVVGEQPDRCLKRSSCHQESKHAAPSSCVVRPAAGFIQQAIKQASLALISRSLEAGYDTPVAPSHDDYGVGCAAAAADAADAAG